MSILIIIAFTGIILSTIAYFATLKKKDWRSTAAILSLAAASIALLIAISIIDAKKAQRLAEEPSAQVPADLQDNGETKAPLHPELPAADTDEDTHFDFSDTALESGENAETAGNTEGAETAGNTEGAETAGNTEGAETAGNTDGAETAGNTEGTETAGNTEGAETAGNTEGTETAGNTEGAETAGNTEAAADPLAPTANAGKDESDVKIGETVSFSGRKSKKNPKGSAIVSYHWDFGDGSTADTRDASHAYAQGGQFIATLTVIDKDGRAAAAAKIVDVTRPANKIRLHKSKLTDINNAAKVPAPTAGTLTKTFTGSKMTIEAAGFVASVNGCSCTTTVHLTGPDGCDAVRTKIMKNGDEGEFSLKSICKTGVGDYTWTVSREAQGTCGCTWTDFSIDGYEN